MAVTAESVVVELEARTGQFDARIRQSAQIVDQSMSSVERSAREAERGVDRSSQGIVRSTGAVQQATRNLGFQISDVGQQLSGGQSPFVIFGQQAPQFVQAFEEIAAAGANVGTVLRSIALPGILAVVSVIGTLVEKAFEATDAHDKHRKAVDSLKEAVDRLNGASATLNNTTAIGIQNDIDAANAMRKREIQTRKTLSAELELARGRLEASKTQSENSSEGGVAFGVVAGATQESEIKRLNAALKENASSIKAADQAILAGRGQIVLRNVAAATDAATAATQRYDNTIDRLRRRFESGKLGEAEFDRLATAATRSRDAALKAAQGHGSATSSIVADQARLAAANTDVRRAEAQLSITRRQALADQKAGRITASEAEARIASATSKVYAAQDAAKAHGKALRDEAKAARDLASALDEVIQRLDPERAARGNFTKTLGNIDDLTKAGKLSAGDAAIYKQRAVELENARRAAADAGTFKKIFGDGDPLGETVKEADRDREARFDAAVQADNAAQATREDNVRSLANLYEDLFTQGSARAWDNFKRDGLRTLAIVLAQATISSFTKGGGGFGSLLGNITKAAGAAGGIPGFAGGGSMVIGGNAGVDSNLLSLNGRPIAAVSRGESLSISPNGRAASPQSGAGAVTIVSSPQFNLRGAVVTPELYADMERISARSAAQARDQAVSIARKGLPSAQARFGKLGTTG